MASDRDSMTSGGELLAGVGAAASGGHCLQRQFQTERMGVKCESLERPTTAESALPTQPCEWPVSCSLSYANEVEQ